MTRATAAAAIAGIALLAACSSQPSGPPEIVPEPGAPKPPVVRHTVPTPPAAPVPDASGVPLAMPAGAVYACVVGYGERRTVTSIEFVPKVAALCSRHPEMGPCQYEREGCRRNGGRVFARDGTEITAAMEAEYDKKVMRIRFRAD